MKLSITLFLLFILANVNAGELTTMYKCKSFRSSWDYVEVDFEIYNDGEIIVNAKVLNLFNSSGKTIINPGLDSPHKQTSFDPITLSKEDARYMDEIPAIEAGKDNKVDIGLYLNEIAFKLDEKGKPYFMTEILFRTSSPIFKNKTIGTNGYDRSGVICKVETF